MVGWSAVLHCRVVVCASAPAACEIAGSTTSGSIPGSPARHEQSVLEGVLAQDADAGVLLVAGQLAHPADHVASTSLTLSQVSPNLPARYLPMLTAGIPSGVGTSAPLSGMISQVSISSCIPANATTCFWSSRSYADSFTSRGRQLVA